MFPYLPSHRSAKPARHYATRGSIITAALPFGCGLTALVHHYGTSCLVKLSSRISAGQSHQC
ncbi:hypothetical protein EC55989_2639 [Escherichia coli 55989]|uniref:Uncharacterized protein n=1 Tax=Escherichia coli (strain 55989 / EAEC) TaxID=585055 RepID=B7LBP9_ECO55|nr:hypothetical protein EC55989_2639 [Escherichia coli 55989]DAI79621.1 MAG TPA: hypothetical protein [Bacteriophage sp.]